MKNLTLDQAYATALEDLLDNGIVTSPRGMKVRELLGYKMTVDPAHNIVTLPGFETDIDYAKLELDWYLSGTDRIDFHPRIEKTWKRFSDNGETVNSAYGHYLFNQGWTINQWDWVKNKIREDPDTRQAVMNINQPYHKTKPTKDFPCTIAAQVLLRNGELDWITYMRSQDLFYGTRNDVFCFTELQKKMADEIGAGVGTYHHMMGSMHLYEKHWPIAAMLFREDAA